MSTITSPIELIINHRRYIAVPEEEYEKLVSHAPELPPANTRGNRDAVKFAEASIARSIVRRREAAGWTQKRLAREAGIRVEVLNRAERGVVVPSVRTLTRIEVGLSKAAH